MADENASRQTPAKDDLTEALRALREARQAAEETFQAECGRLAKKYSITADQAREMVFAFDDLLHLGRHHSGRQRLVALGEKVGAFLLDQIIATAPEEHQHRPQFITEALCQCLGPQVEAELVRLLEEKALPLDLRGYAIVALAHGREPAGRQLLVKLFNACMQRDRGDREPTTYPALVRAMLRVKDPGAVGGLTRVIAEERRASSTEMVIGAIPALGEIGEARAIPALRKLIKNRQRWPRAPHACLVRAKLKDDKVRELTETARGLTYHWTAWQLEVFDEIEKVAPFTEKDKKRLKKHGKTVPEAPGAGAPDADAPRDKGASDAK